ncbi:alkyl hydroperoxide reductase, partial [Mycobacterium tuberculosis]|nr:alkyl hydroperoxide reductase [Mycobacterium tuberculosis]
MSIAALQAHLPAFAKDVRLNLSAMAEDEALTVQQKYGLMVACGHATRNATVAQALEAEAAAHLGAEAL